VVVTLGRHETRDKGNHVRCDVRLSSKKREKKKGKAARFIVAGQKERKLLFLEVGHEKGEEETGWRHWQAV